MELVIKANILDRNRVGINIDLVPELYDHTEMDWVDFRKIMKDIGSEAQFRRRLGQHRYTYSQKSLGRFFPQALVPIFRLTVDEFAGKSEVENQRDIAFVFNASPNVIISKNQIIIDFGDILFLGQEYGYVSERINAADDFILGIAAPNDEEAFHLFANALFERNSIKEKLEALSNKIKKLGAHLTEANNTIISKNNVIEQNIRALNSCEKRVEGLQQNKQELETSLVSIEQENSRLLEAKKKLQQELEACQNEKIELLELSKQVTEQLSSAQGDIESKKGTITALEAKLLAAELYEENLRQCQEDNRSLQDNLETVKSLRDEIQVQLNSKNGELNNLSRDLNNSLKAQADLEKNIVQTESSLDAIEAAAQEQAQTISTLESTLADERDEKQNLTKQIEKLEGRLAELAKDENSLDLITSELRSKLTRKTAEFETANKQLVLMREQRKSEVAVQDVFTRIGEDIGAAASSLLLNNTPYKLGRVNMNIKGVLGPEGSTIYLPDAALPAHEAPVSSIDLELIPDDSVSAETDASGLFTPNVIGLTESAANKLLSEAGLKLKISRMPVKTAKDHGRAVRQLPEAGTPISPTQTLRVTFGQNIMQEES